MKPIISYVIKLGGLFLLIGVGIWLYFLREQKMPKPVTHEVIIAPKKSTQRIVADEFLILVHKEHVQKLNQILNPLSLELKMPILNWLLVKKISHNGPKVVPIIEAMESSQLLSSLMQHPLVLDAQHNYILDPAELHEKKSIIKEWQFKRPSSELPASINLQAAWEIIQGSAEVTVGIVDQFLTEGRFTFKERFLDCSDRVTLFAPKLWPTSPEDGGSLPHGEVMLQALGACEGLGITHKTRLLAIERPSLGHAQTFIAMLLANRINLCEQSVISCPKDFTLQFPEVKPDIFLLPFGGDAPELLQFTTDMIAALRASNAIVITAAGNDQTNAQNFFPGGSPDVINVGALDKRGARANFSNWGPTVDIMAPGADISLQYPNGEKRFFGTSIGAIFVAGTIALMKSVNRELSQNVIMSLLATSARPLSCTSYCKNFSNCSNLCCDGERMACGKLALDTGMAVQLAKASPPLPPIISISNHYLLFLRDESLAKEIRVENLGDKSAIVIANTSDPNVTVMPKEFILTKKNGKQAQVLTVSLKNEPYRRQTYKVALKAQTNGATIDQQDFYIEYIPKK